MKTKTGMSALTIIFCTFILLCSSSFSQEQSKQKKSREEKLAEKQVIFSHIDSLIQSRQFVFQADFGPRSDEIYLIVDSSYAEIQNGNRNNLEGKITQFEIDRKPDKLNIAVTILMRGDISTADIFLFIGSEGFGKATVKSDFPGDFSFDGKVVDFENARI